MNKDLIDVTQLCNQLSNQYARYGFSPVSDRTVAEPLRKIFFSNVKFLNIFV